MQEMRWLIILSVMVLVPLVGCLGHQAADLKSNDYNRTSTLYNALLDRPSKEHLLDLLCSCSDEYPPSEESLMFLLDRLKETDRTVCTVDGVEYKDHEIVVACLYELTAYSIDMCLFPVKAIISRRVDETLYRYHIYTIEDRDASRVEQFASVWIDGYFEGKRVAFHKSH